MPLVVLLVVLLSRDALAFYNSQTGRWLSRDPIGERGGANVYEFARNNAVQSIDPDGRVTYENCPRAAQERIQSAIDEACRRIKSPDFGCCMVGSGLGRAYPSKLSYLCNRGFHVKCTLELETPTGGTASGSADTQTIKIYNIFFTHAGGWGDGACVLGHEMLHLLGPRHPKWDRFFNRLHECLGCRPYTDSL